MTGPQSPSSGQSAGTASSPDVDYIALKPGQTIGRYEIVSVLGQGGFGITYRARDIQLDREVAIKEYLPSALAFRQDGITVLPRTTKMADDFGWGRERFVTEGRTLASLHRVPAIVRVFDFLQSNGTAYIVMELLHGETLEDRIAKNGKLTAEEVDRILWPLLDGLEQVHNAGFLHRDIKPANILLDAAGNPTLIDFGASRAAMAGRSTPLTAIFTPGYAAAGQMTSAKQGPWTDVYGLSARSIMRSPVKGRPRVLDRMLNDGYEPLAKLDRRASRPASCGLDAGLAVARAREAAEAFAGWRRSSA
jgi:serine/threonine protein kinase